MNDYILICLDCDAVSDPEHNGHTCTECGSERTEAHDRPEDEGRWQSGYRSFGDGSYREDFRSDC